MNFMDRGLSVKVQIIGCLALIMGCTSSGENDTAEESFFDRGDLGQLIDLPIDSLPQDTMETSTADVISSEILSNDVAPDAMDLSTTDTTFFPPPPESPCIDGGDGVQGWLQFDDGAPLSGALVTISYEEQHFLGYADEEGFFFIQAPCQLVDVTVTRFDSSDRPLHPNLINLPLNNFDASSDVPTLSIPLVAVEGVVLDIMENPIPEARLEAHLVDGGLEVYNDQETDALGQFSVNLVPHPSAAYEITALGPQDSDKTYRTVTLSTLIEDPPPEPITFILYEDRCGIDGPVSTSEGVPLEWLYLFVDGDPYLEGSITYYSFSPGYYYESSTPDVITEELPLFCGNQTLKLWNAVWTNPDWPCLNANNPDQLCLWNYPFWIDTEITESSEDGLQVPVVRAEGTVLDDFGIPQESVVIRYEGRYQWGDGFYDYADIINEVETDDSGHYSLVLLDYEGTEYTVTARLRDTDVRPLGDFEGTVVVEGPVTYDITLPEAPPSCILLGTIHSNEGHDFHEIQTDFWGYDEAGLSLYIDLPYSYFSPEPGIYHRYDEPDEEVYWIPLLCGDHDLTLNSANWEGCYSSSDEICFYYFSWWGSLGYDGPRKEILDPLEEGLEIPVAHVSGFVRDSAGIPVEGIALSAMYNQTIFTYALNNTSSDATGLYDMVVLPNQTWTLTASLPDDHPRINDLWTPEGLEVTVTEAGIEASFTMPDGPERCPLSGPVTTSDGVDLERIEFFHYSPWYGLMGWQFRSDEPAVYYRTGNTALTLDSIPLVCGVQDLFINSRFSTYYASCNDPERFDQPCLNDYHLWQSHDLSGPEHGFEIEVVTLSGHITEDGEIPIEGAEIEAYGTIYREEEGALVLLGEVSNFALSRPDGSYELALLPTDLSSYEISITTPISVDLGEITHIETINEDRTIDADFSHDQ